MKRDLSALRTSSACGRSGIVLTVAASLLALSPMPAVAFEIFGIKLFEGKDERLEVINPVDYSIDLDIDSGDAALDDDLRRSSLLLQNEGEPVSGDLGLVIRARDDRDRLVATLYENSRYGGVVTVRVDGTRLEELPPNPTFRKEGPIPVTISVDPGPSFVLGKFTLGGDAARLDPSDYDLEPGDAAGSDKILAAAERVVIDLKAEGRPLARLTARDVIADHERRTVDVTIAADGGPKAPIGDVSVSGTKSVEADFVARYSRVRPGQPYFPEQLDAAAKRLRELGVFSSVTMKEADTLAADGSLPIEIEVSEGKHRYFGLGATVSSIDGFGLQGYWGHRNLFGQAEQLRIEGSIGRLGDTQELGNLDYATGISFTKPGAFFPAATLSASILGATRETTSYDINTVTAQTSLAYEMTDRDTISGGVAVEWANVDDAFGENEYLTVYTPFEYVRDARDDTLNPTEGYRASFAASPSYETFGSTPFISLQGSVTGYLGLGEEDRIVLAGKIAGGSVFGSGSLSDIPTNRRFFAGGGGSVRGYAFEEISPYNADDDPTGGRSFATASFEARIKITEAIGVVPFIDVGTVSASNFPDFSDIRAGAGIGLRYATPFGPIRLDVAMPLDRYDGGSDYGIYAGIGQSF
ncbi:autotransporter assembly complex family protein [Ciceribacter sp. L1K22]|uniref:autotransporter assembly complex protein TamA n=1 Tax=Ciceribacter sp. L1K22 TaxID=2820275 RepID=UPI001ABDABCA|nr:autotransporter assembly complex family protein [Ciceribacter sp. L1K22]MBO3762436.1 outer membrane protein assembly factor [Ciceribacter sp. L1K22]